MTRCRHCLTQAELRDGRCPVCGIEPGKRKGDLSPGEQKVRRHARAILLMAALHFIGTAAGLVALFRMHGSLLAQGIAILVVINAALAIGLSRYALWAYRLAVTFYFLIGIVNVISVNLGGILVALIALYLVGNATAKALFERRLPEQLS